MYKTTTRNPQESMTETMTEWPTGVTETDVNPAVQYNITNTKDNVSQIEKKQQQLTIDNDISLRTICNYRLHQHSERD